MVSYRRICLNLEVISVNVINMYTGNNSVVWYTYSIKKIFEETMNNLHVIIMSSLFDHTQVNQFNNLVINTVCWIILFIKD